MKKILLKINKKEELKYPCKGFILGLNNYSIGYETSFDIEDIKEIIKENTDKEIFVSLNRVIFNNEVDNYKKILIELDNLNLAGIIVSDIAALTYDLRTSIILDQMHLNNSYLSINHYSNNNVKGFVLTNDITKDEINIIKEKTNTLLFKQVFGYMHLSSSKRSLLSNYKNYYKINHNSKKYKIGENNSDDIYPIIEDYFGTHIYSSNPLNLLDEINNLNIDYFILDSYLFDGNYLSIVECFNNEKIEESNKIDELYKCTKGFINTKTIYKVKKDEK